MTTPCLALDLGEVARNYGNLIQWLPGASIWYSVKANDHPAVLGALVNLGAGFHVSSEAELEHLRVTCGVTGERIVATDPIKSVQFIEAAYDAGVRRFGCDSAEEAAKLAAAAPGSGVYVRLNIRPEEHALPVADVGVNHAELGSVLEAIGSCGLHLLGFTFHVGSNAKRASAWVEAIGIAREAMCLSGAHGQEAECLNVGGGLPAEQALARDICCAIAAEVEELRRTVAEVAIEPGRYLVGSAGTMVGQVIGKARRRGRVVAHLDVGVYNGLHEAMEGVEYPVTCKSRGQIVVCDVLGPTCSGLDVIARGVEMPEPSIGDYVYIGMAGAYSISATTCFCRLPQPHVQIAGGDRRRLASSAGLGCGTMDSGSGERIASPGRGL